MNEDDCFSIYLNLHLITKFWIFRRSTHLNFQTAYHVVVVIVFLNIYFTGIRRPIPK